MWLGGARLRQDLLGFAVALGLGLAYPVYIGGDWMPMHRFLSGAVLFGVPLVFWGATAVGGRVAMSRSVFQTITVVVVLLLTLATSARSSNNLRLLVLATAMELFAEVGKAAKGGDPSLTYAVADIGRVGWHSEARVLDLLGLVERAVAVALQSRRGPDATEAIEVWQPDVFLLKWLVGSVGQLSAVHEKMVDFAPEPFDAGAPFLARATPNTQGDQDAAIFMGETGGYYLVNLMPFPNMAQFYTVYAHERARSRIARALTTIRPYSGLSHYLAGDRDYGLALLEEQLRRSPFDQIGRVNQSVRLADADRLWEALSQALALDPEHSLAQGNLAWTRRQILERESGTATP